MLAHPFSPSTDQRMDSTDSGRKDSKKDIQADAHTARKTDIQTEADIHTFRRKKDRQKERHTVRS